MNYRNVANTADLPEGKMLLVSVGDVEILLANVDGTYYAIANRCPHLGGPLVKGMLTEDVVTCPRHGAQFDVRTGKCLRGAKIAFVKMDVDDVRTYPGKVEGAAILVGVEG